jgi:hypothetical protein
MNVVQPTSDVDRDPADVVFRVAVTLGMPKLLLFGSFTQAGQLLQQPFFFTLATWGQRLCSGTGCSTMSSEHS